MPRSTALQWRKRTESLPLRRAPAWLSVATLTLCASVACNGDSVAGAPTSSNPNVPPVSTLGAQAGAGASAMSDPAAAGAGASAMSHPAAAGAGGAAMRDPAAGSPIATPDFCARPGDDEIREVFCASPPPAIASLQDLQRLFDLDPHPRDPNAPVDPLVAAQPSAQNGDVTLLGHSTALPGRIITPINPRAIILGTRAVLAYQRGVQRIELTTRTRDTFDPVFYLVTFEQACNQRPGGCRPGDLYTPNIERDWTHVQVFDDEDLKNTAADCRQCHRRGTATSVFLMRELRSPWTHFFEALATSNGLPGVTGSDLLQDYLDAKGDELYGGIPVGMIAPGAAFGLQSYVGDAQPLVFDAPKIQSERWPYGPDGYPAQPGPSPTWEAAYEAFKRGEQLALPYLEPRAVDVNKQAALAQAYRRYRAGELDADALPDLADAFPDDPMLRARIGLQTEPNAAPEDVLIQACGACHNDVLDQTISRARFTIALGRLDRAELDVAIARIELPRDAPGAMPPPEARQLDEGGRSRLLEFLRMDLSKLALPPQLEQAAKLGMAGGGM